MLEGDRPGASLPSSAASASLKIAGRDSLQVKEDQHLQSARAPRIGLRHGVATGLRRQPIGEYPVSGIALIEQAMPQCSTSEPPSADPAKILNRQAVERGLDFGHL